MSWDMTRVVSDPKIIIECMFDSWSSADLLTVVTEAHRQESMLTARKLAAIAEELSRYDWSTIAVSEFGESSAWFHPDIERLKAIPLELHAYDSANDLVIWRGQGWEMPKQARTVYRFPVLYIATDPTGATPAQAFITIEGYTEEES